MKYLTIPLQDETAEMLERIARIENREMSGEMFATLLIEEGISMEIKRLEEVNP